MSEPTLEDLKIAEERLQRVAVWAGRAPMFHIERVGRFPRSYVLFGARAEVKRLRKALGVAEEAKSDPSKDAA